MRCVICGAPARVGIGAVDYCGEHAADGAELEVRQAALAHGVDAETLEASVAQTRAVFRGLFDE